jgi:hypothetical protein
MMAVRVAPPPPIREDVVNPDPQVGTFHQPDLLCKDMNRTARRMEILDDLKPAGGLNQLAGLHHPAHAHECPIEDSRQLAPQCIFQSGFLFVIKRLRQLQRDEA